MEKSETGPALAQRPAEASLHWRAPLRLRLMMLSGAVLAALAVGGVILLVASQPTAALFSALANGTFGTGQLATLWPFMAVVLVAVVASAVGVYHLARATILVRGWQRYLLGVTRECSDYLSRHARLVALGYHAQARMVTAEGTAAAPTEPLEGLFQARPRLLVTGDDGAGKSVALVRHTLEIARGARIGRMITGRQLIPLYLSFPAYAQAAPAPEGLRVDLLVAQMRRFGAHLLAGRLPVLLRRGRVVLLLDGVDEVPTELAVAVLNELENGVRGAYRNVRLCLTCRADVVESLLPEAPLLRYLTPVAITPLPPDEMRQLVRRAGRSGLLGTRAPEAIISAIDQRDLVATLSSPALLAMLLEVVEVGAAVPPTRAHLIAAFDDLLYRRMAIPTEQIETTRRMLGYLALSLHFSASSTLTGNEGWNPRESLRVLLGTNDGAVTQLGRLSRPLYQVPDLDLDTTLEVALKTGILERGPEGRSLRFRHVLLLFLAAARHLDVNDAGLGRISPLLLRPEWIAILILWGGLTEDPTGLADRLARFALAPAGVVAVARLGTQEQVEPLVLALALVVGVISLAPLVTTLSPEPPVQARADFAQQHLRDLFDHVLRYGVDDQQPERRARLRAALRICEAGTAGDLTPALARLVRSPLANRILRAQAVQVLGLLASPMALAALTTLLLEPDPTVREALSRGFHLAGAEAADPLLNLIAAHPIGEVIHRRAIDAIAAVDGPAVAPALTRLSWPEPSARAAAAAALGALRDRRALEALLEAAKDPAPEVQIAAIRALGRLGDLKAQPALLPLLQSPSEALRIVAAEALGLMRSDRAIKPLIKLLEDGQPRVRAAAAEALGHLGDIRAIDALRQHLSDRDAWAQAAAATALRALGQRD